MTRAVWPHARRHGEIVPPATPYYDPQTALPVKAGLVRLRDVGAGLGRVGGRRAWATALALGFFFLIVATVSFPDLGHVPRRVGFCVGRIGRCDWLSQILNETVGMAFAKNILVADAPEDDRLIRRNFEPLNSATLSARPNLVPELYPPINWSLRQLGNFIGLTPPVAILENFAFCFSMIIDVELEPISWSHFLRDDATRELLKPASWPLLRTTPGRHVSTLDLMTVSDLVLADIFRGFRSLSHFLRADANINGLGNEGDQLQQADAPYPDRGPEHGPIRGIILVLASVLIGGISSIWLGPNYLDGDNRSFIDGALIFRGVLLVTFGFVLTIIFVFLDISGWLL